MDFREFQESGMLSAFGGTTAARTGPVTGWIGFRTAGRTGNYDEGFDHRSGTFHVAFLAV